MQKYRIFLTRLFGTISLMFLVSSLCLSKESMMAHKFTNALIHETNPYLLQHAHNPVEWHAWSNETLALAKKENKLLLISIGYAACHWCHVMEHESFEDEAVAKIMNKYFINVKVDREERPDVDQVYMNAVQLITGRGGWPLNCLALPDGRPIWGGTYFPKENWINALTQIATLFKNDPGKAEKYAVALTEGVRKSDLVTLNTNKTSFKRSELDKTVATWQASMDMEKGGREGAPKFLLPNNYQFLLRYAKQSGNKQVMDFVKTTLTKMAYGGIFDQVGGGFARYSVDENWHIPHFEKMLYDNGQMVSLYANAYAATQDTFYKDVVYRTTQFVERELMSENGAFYSSLDADSENEQGELEEGAYYVWEKKELQQLIKKDYSLFSDYYNINDFYQWEHDTYNLHRTESDAAIAKLHGISVEMLAKKVSVWQGILLNARERKSRPRLDDKTLTSWNALMLKGYVDAYRVFDDEHFLERALANANFLVSVQMRKEGGLYRNFKNKKSTINAYLEDYASVIDAFIGLYEVTFDEQWLQYAKGLTDYSFTHFQDKKSKMFFFTSDEDKDLIARKIEVDDNVIPASNSMMANNLFRLGHYFSNKIYSSTAKQMLHNVKDKSLQYGAGASNWLILFSNYLSDFYEVAIVGEDAVRKQKELNQHYIPNILMVGSSGASELPLLKHKFQ